MNPQKGRRPQFSPWAECFLCGEDHPQDTMVRHVRLGQLVDKDCADELGYEEVFAKSSLPRERPMVSERPVRDQGEFEHLVTAYLAHVLALEPNLLLDYSTTTPTDLTGNFTQAISLVSPGTAKGEDPNNQPGAFDTNASGYITIPASALLDPGTGSMTWESWARHTSDPSVDGYGGIFHKSPNFANDGAAIYFQNQNGYYTLAATIDTNYSATAIRSSLSWNHIAVTWTRGASQTVIAIYVNGSKLVTSNVSNGNILNSSRLLIGAMAEESDFIINSNNTPTDFCTSLFGTAIYPIALSDSQIHSNFQALSELPA